jgi:hypothetical protein
VFGHLGLPLYGALDKIPLAQRYHARHTAGDPKSDARQLLRPHQLHPVVRAGILSLGVELPIDGRRPKLSVDSSAAASLADELAPVDWSCLVLLHPGRGAAPDTFPPDVWHAYADALVDKGYQVAVVGTSAKQVPASKTPADKVPAIVPFDRSRCIDLVDQLSLAELLALVSRARVLVSNDSGLVQAAGAFDNWIGAIATLRHPDHVLPWRKGAQSWRAKALARKPLYLDYVHKPSGCRQRPLDECDDARLRACLPEPASVVAFVEAAFASGGE